MNAVLLVLVLGAEPEDAFSKLDEVEGITIESRPYPGSHFAQLRFTTTTSQSPQALYDAAYGTGEFDADEPGLAARKILFESENERVAYERPRASAARRVGARDQAQRGLAVRPHRREANHAHLLRLHRTGRLSARVRGDGCTQGAGREVGSARHSTGAEPTSEETQARTRGFITTSTVAAPIIDSATNISGPKRSFASAAPISTAMAGFTYE